MEIFFKTLQQVLVMIFFIAIGYFMHRKKFLPVNAAKTISSLLTNFILPAYVIGNLSANVTRESIAMYGSYMLAGLVCLAAFLAIAYALSRVLKNTFSDRKLLLYMLAFSNYSYFGYPLIEFVYGAEVLAKVLVFVIPLTVFIYTSGVRMIVSGGEKGENRHGKYKIQPVIPALIFAIIMGLIGVDLTGESPDFLLTGAGMIISSAKSCMSALSMLLTGIVLAKFSLKELGSSWKAVVIAAVRLVLIPAVVIGICLLLRLLFGLEGEQYLLIPAVISAMPIGMNIVIFRGDDGADSAKVCFYSLILALMTIPTLFMLLQYIA